MVIKYIEDVYDSLSSRTNFIRSINLQGALEGILLLGLTEEDEPEVLRLLNSIANQGIESINFYRSGYTIDGKLLHFSSLSTSELLFLLAYAANKMKKEIYFCNDINQLTGTTLRKFIGYFYSSPYVNILYTSNDLDAFFDVIVEEVIDNDKSNSR